jgi:hypothetical protein
MIISDYDLRVFSLSRRGRGEGGFLRGKLGRMKRLLLALTLSTLVFDVALAQAPVAPAAPAARPGAAVKYGSNTAAGRTFVHDGVRLYYEVYGTGEPLLVVHGNGGSIGDLTPQIAHFRQRYQVIAMDSRDHGKSADSPDGLTYEKPSPMTTRRSSTRLSSGSCARRS